MAMRIFPGTDRAIATPVAPPVSPAVTPPAGSPAILLTDAGWLVGDLVGIEGRVIDALAGRQTIGLMTGGGYREVDLDEIDALVPLVTQERPEVRIAKRRIPVTIDLPDDLCISGNCHLLPGATVWDVWQHSSSGFAALTEVVVGFPDGTTETADVVLVSRHAAASGLRSA